MDQGDQELAHHLKRLMREVDTTAEAADAGNAQALTRAGRRAVRREQVARTSEVLVVTGAHVVMLLRWW